MTADLQNNSLSETIHIVLVEPEDSLNIGSVARAMKNLGYKHLHLVKPANFDFQRACITGRWASDLLENVQIHETIPEAVGEMSEVVGFSGREGRNRGNLVLPEWVTQMRGHPILPTALLFGPEDTGLRNEHIEHCRWLVRIPSTVEYPAFNLAQAVLIALFELVRQDWEGLSSATPQHAPEWNDFYQLDRLLENVLTKSGFFREGTPEPIPGLVKSLFRRTQPDKREMGVLLALFARLEKSIVQ